MLLLHLCYLAVGFRFRGAGVGHSILHGLSEDETFMLLHEIGRGGDG